MTASQSLSVGEIGMRLSRLLLLGALVDLSCALNGGPDGPLAKETELLTGSVTLNVALPAGVPLHQVLLGASGSVALGATVFIQGTASSPVTLTVTGQAGATVGANAQIQNLTSQGPIDLGAGVEVSGSVISGASISEKKNVIVAGSIQQNATLTPFEQFSWTVDFPAPGAAVSLSPGSAQTLAPGAYGDVSLQPGSTLKLTAGTYFMSSLSTQPQSTLSVDVSSGPASIYVASSLSWKGSVDAGGHEHDVLLGYLGSDTVFLHSAFTGTIVAPGAGLKLLPVGNPGYRGSFFAQTIDVQPGSGFTLDPSTQWGALIPPTPILECVIPPAPGMAATAVFGYNNPLDTATTVAGGPTNHLVPIPPGGRIPGPVFLPGLHHAAFMAQFYGSTLAWTLGAQTAIANANSSPRCSAATYPFVGVPGLDPGVGIVETGHPLDDPTVVLVDVDNPAYEFPLTLQFVPLFPSIGALDGGPEMVPQEVITNATNQETNFPFGSFFMRADGPGSAPSVLAAGALFVSSPPCTTPPCVASQTDRVSVYTNMDGDIKAPDVAPFQAHGLRVGYMPQPLTLTPIAEYSDESLHTTGEVATIALDPNTLLVPVEVVVLVSDNFTLTDPNSPVSKYALSNQLTYWDGNPLTVDILRNLQALPNNAGEALLSTDFKFQAWDSTVKDSNGHAVGPGGFTPDSIWATCGVQFRMANFIVIHTDDDHVLPPDSLCPVDADSYLINVANLIDSDPNHIPDIPAVLFSGRCTCATAAQGLDPTEHGARVVGTPPTAVIACFPFGASSLITGAHEMGHVLGLCDAYADSSRVNGACPGDYQTNCATNRYGVMCSEDDKPTPTAIECQVARQNASAFHNFWQH
jgi:hypothetical protein